MPCPPPTPLLPLLLPSPALTPPQTASTSPTLLPPRGQTVSSTALPFATIPLPLLPAPLPDAAAVLATLTTKWALLPTLPSKTLPTPARKPPAGSASRLSSVVETSFATAMQSSRMSSPSPTRRAAKFLSSNEVGSSFPSSSSSSCPSHTLFQPQIISSL